ncbi:predicted protein [Uncinocarpus reesii 1704]|uniref:Uncharacterized protein n=1 Tax=Uncinocarpus reesii (strain UAMH 1704) TaxID=336963 RepID=C4JP32_UNCRE|nr:uncharacterized protein UREG_03091 [Uncinocarpus reesii 1704]EEP78246.1 predicted protein [Uncinocarpus reesii 1704]
MAESSNILQAIIQTPDGAAVRLRDQFAGRNYVFLTFHSSPPSREKVVSPINSTAEKWDTFKEFSKNTRVQARSRWKLWLETESECAVEEPCVTRNSSRRNGHLMAFFPDCHGGRMNGIPLRGLARRQAEFRTRQSGGKQHAAAAA